MEGLVNAACPNPCELVVTKYSLDGDSEAILELIYLEFVMLRERGREPTVEQYQSRFPELSDEIQSLLEVDSVIGVGMEPTTTVRDDARDDTHRPLRTLGGGQQVLGPYRLIEVIGRGGMGVVYRAVQEGLNRTVALKTLNILASLEQSARDRFQTEASLAAQLQHPHIVQIYEIGSDGGIPYYSMELIAGKTLSKVLKEGPLIPATAAQLLLMLARAVAYAHARGVIHRDLKPGNVLLAPSSRLDAPVLSPNSQAADSFGEIPLQRIEPKIADFGLAKQLDGSHEMTASGTMLGTPGFMAPEQVVSSSGVGAACDVYALGAILYNMLSGQPPFQSPSPMETLRQVREKEPVPLRYLQPHTPRDLETICLKCLRKYPASRYDSADELAADLDRFLRRVPITARPAGAAERLMKWTRRHPSLASLLLAVCVALAAITWLWRSSESSRKAEELARQRTEQSLYAHSISMLYSQLRLNHISQKRVREKLDEWPANARGWEWHYLRGLCGQAAWESPATQQTITTASLSPDGRFAALGCGQWGYDSAQVIEVWDTWENKLRWRLQGHPECQVSCVRFSPDGKYLASSAIVWRNPKTPGGVLLWDLSTGKLDKTIANINADVLSFSVDGKSVFVGGLDGAIHEISCETAKPLRTMKGLSGMILEMQFSPDFKKLAASGRNDSWGVFDVESGKADWILRKQGDIRQLCWSSDGLEISTGRYDGLVRTFRYDPKQPILSRTERFSAQPYMFASPDGMWRAGAVFGKDIELREERSDHLVGSFSGHGGDVRALGFDDSCRRMISAGGDGVARVWELSNSHSALRTAFLPLGCAAACLSYHPTEPRIAFGTKKSPSRSGGYKPLIEIWHAETQKSLRSLKGHSDELTHVAYSPDGRQLISASRDQTVRLWDPELGKELAVLRGHESAVILADFLQDGSQAISIDVTGKVVLWDTARQQLVSQWNTEFPVETAAFQPRLGLLAAARKSGEVLLWSLDTQTPKVRQVSSRAIASIAFNAQGSALAVGGDWQEIDLWDLEQLLDDRPLNEPKKRLKGNSLTTSRVRFSPDGTRLCAIGRDDMVRIYDTQLGNELLSLESGEVGNEHLVSFSADGRQIVRAAGVKIFTWSILDPNRRKPPSQQYSIQSLIRWHQSRMNAAFSAKHMEAALYHCKRLTQLQPENRDSHCQSGMIRMKMNDWKNAEQDFQKGIELSSSILNRSKYAITLLRLNKHEEYVKQCKLLTISAHLSNAPGIHMAARTIALAPDPGLNTTALARLVEKTQAVTPEPKLLNTLALLQYRSQKYEDAMQTAQQSIKANQQSSPPMDWMVIALAQAQVAHGTTPLTNEADVHPTVRQYARMIVQWCQRQQVLMDAGIEPAENLEVAREELPILYAELLKILGGQGIPQLDIP
jgi:serine/threonine protein kinase/WD40 repeat protein